MWPEYRRLCTYGVVRGEGRVFKPLSYTAMRLVTMWLYYMYCSLVFICSKLVQLFLMSCHAVVVTDCMIAVVCIRWQNCFSLLHHPQSTVVHWL